MFQISSYVMSKSGRTFEIAKDGTKPARSSACHNEYPERMT